MTLDLEDLERELDPRIRLFPQQALNDVMEDAKPLDGWRCLHVQIVADIYEHIARWAIGPTNEHDRADAMAGCEAEGWEENQLFSDIIWLFDGDNLERHLEYADVSDPETLARFVRDKATEHLADAVENIRRYRDRQVRKWCRTQQREYLPVPHRKFATVQAQHRWWRKRIKEAIWWAHRGADLDSCERYLARCGLLNDDLSELIRSHCHSDGSISPILKSRGLAA